MGIRLEFQAEGSQHLTAVYVEPESKGYYLTELKICGVPFHVEVVEVFKGGDNPVAKNKLYQERINSWFARNEGLLPKLVEIEGHEYFIDVQVYAA
jgi:hypothetical protein